MTCGVADTLGRVPPRDDGSPAAPPELCRYRWHRYTEYVRPRMVIPNVLLLLFGGAVAYYGVVSADPPVVVAGVCIGVFLVPAWLPEPRRIDVIDDPAAGPAVRLRRLPFLLNPLAFLLVVAVMLLGAGIADVVDGRLTGGRALGAVLTMTPILIGLLAWVLYRNRGFLVLTDECLRTADGRIWRFGAVRIGTVTGEQDVPLLALGDSESSRRGWAGMGAYGVDLNTMASVLVALDERHGASLRTPPGEIVAMLTAPPPDPLPTLGLEAEVCVRAARPDRADGRPARKPRT